MGVGNYGGPSSRGFPDTSRPEIEDLMRERKIHRYDELQMLAELGSQTITDPFEIRRATAA